MGVALLLLAGCGADGESSGDSPSNDIKGSVKEWEVKVDHTKATAGSVTFTVTNEGTIAHEFLIVKTDIPNGEIPVTDGRFSEDEVEVVDEIAEFAVKTTESITLDLEAGEYQLVCNIQGHYEAGMHVEFEVVAA